MPELQQEGQVLHQVQVHCLAVLLVVHACLQQPQLELWLQNHHNSPVLARTVSPLTTMVPGAWPAQQLQGTLTKQHTHSLVQAGLASGHWVLLPQEQQEQS